MKAWQRTLYDGGWAGITWPKAFGGRGGDAIQQAIFAQEQARFDVAYGRVHGRASPWSARRSSPTAPTSRRTGSSIPHARGDEVWCQLFSEPDAGSRPRRPHDQRGPRRRRVASSTVRRCGPRARTSATGASCSPAPIRTRRSTGASRTSSSTCDRRASRSGRLRQITGAAHFNEVFLDDVRVPGRERVGRRSTAAGGGHDHAGQRALRYRWRAGRRNLAGDPRAGPSDGPHRRSPSRGRRLLPRTHGSRSCASSATALRPPAVAAALPVPRARS